MGGLGVKVEHFPLTLLVVLTTLTLPCERDNNDDTMPIYIDRSTILVIKDEYGPSADFSKLLVVGED